MGRIGSSPKANWGFNWFFGIPPVPVDTAQYPRFGGVARSTPGSVESLNRTGFDGDSGPPTMTVGVARRA